MSSYPSSQAKLYTQVQASFLKDDAVVVAFEGEEQIGHNFFFTISCYVKNKIDLTKTINQELALLLLNEKDAQQRAIHGIVIRAKGGGMVKDEWFAYEFFISSALFSLNMGVGCQIYQKKSAVDMIKDVLSKGKVTKTQVSPTKTYNPFEYYVRYQQTPFLFMQRLMEEEGLFYYFSHKKDGHTLVVGDANSNFQSTGLTVDMSLNAKHIGQIESLNQQSQLCLKTCQSHDYLYDNPTLKLTAKSNSSISFAAQESYIYPGLYTTVSDGEEKTDHWLKGSEAQANTIVGKSRISQLCPGFSIKLSNYDDISEDIVMSKVHHYYKDMEYWNTFEGFLKSSDFNLPLQAPRPKVEGIQTAVVTGTSGSNVYGDEMGQIKVQFFWDLDGKMKEDSSLWVRVMEQIAGPSFGFLFTPRMGMEVAVAFLDGHPNRPLVIGSVYHKNNMPHYSMKDKPFYSGIRTKSFKEGFHEIRFSDEAEKEEIYLFSQKDMNTVITNQRTEKIQKAHDLLTLEKGNKEQSLLGEGTHYKIDIKQGDYILNIEKGGHKTELKDGDLSLKMTKGSIKIQQTDGNTDWIMSKGNYTLKLESGKLVIETSGDIDIKTDANMSIKVAKDFKLEAQNIFIESKDNTNIKVGKEMDMKVSKTLNIKSNELDAKTDSDITLKSGSDMTLKSGSGMTLNASSSMNQKAMSVTIKASASMTLNGSASTTVKSGGVVKVTGSMVMLG
jgi:type VI secretion system secreted protein VgrG